MWSQLCWSQWWGDWFTFSLPTDEANFPLKGNMKTKSFIWIFVSIIQLIFLFAFGCGPKAPKLILDAEDQYTLAKREFDNKHWDQAVLELQKLILNYPGVGFIDSAQYLLGLTYFNQKEYPLAIGEFNRLLSSFPTSSLGDDAAFKVAECDFKLSPKAELDQSHTQKAIDELKDFLDDYPVSDKKEPALNLLKECRNKLAKKVYKAGYLYFKMKHYSGASMYFRQVLDEYPDTEWLKPAQFYLAEAMYKEKKYDQAKQEYQNFLQGFPTDELTKKVNKRLEKIVKILASDVKEKTDVEKR
jgi:outer membrane protein assembly factor BamD